MKTDGEIKEAMDALYKISGDKQAIWLAEMREKALMDEQSRLKGATKEGIDIGKKEGLKETIIDNLCDHGKVPINIIETINKQDSMEILKQWNKISVVAESIEEFEEKIK
ncbi:hypothetical protein [Inconstantimicrobium mannanitabidum]|uniref:Uncharacterized protein n=1 Tax=Inconstantimicrobium mannanitabidum TaxID=1604901 RepID=A0ACB5RB67_9CLOT|nr:hypothetical protein [Clostridium sp. TW13]GKX66355.1 hypothetical protein rsdtw13_16130 [Clostridium sp. TW13]